MNEIILEYDLDNKFKVSTNIIYAWCHWRKRQIIANYFHLLVLSDCKQLKQINYKVNIKFIFTFKRNALDSSNCSYMAKCIEDWFKKWGLLKDDSINYVWEFSIKSEKWDKNKINIIISETICEENYKKKR